MNSNYDKLKDKCRYPCPFLTDILFSIHSLAQGDGFFVIHDKLGIINFNCVFIVAASQSIIEEIFYSMCRRFMQDLLENEEIILWNCLQFDTIFTSLVLFKLRVVGAYTVSTKRDLISPVSSLDSKNPSHSKMGIKYHKG